MAKFKTTASKYPNTLAMNFFTAAAEGVSGQVLEFRISDAK